MWYTTAMPPRTRSSTRTAFAPKNKSELFFGLVGAVGTDLGAVFESLKRDLMAVNYFAEEVRLSALLADCDKYAELRASTKLPEH
jgi:hypothetical protein